MSRDETPFDYQAARRTITRRREAHRQRLDERFARATGDAEAIIAMLIRVYRPSRIYQWGSLLDRERFSERSDIDIAVEGIGGADLFFALYRDAEELTSFPLDLVELERIDPLHAESIRTRGRIVHEQI